MSNLRLLFGVVIAMLSLEACVKEARDPCLQPRTSVLRAHNYKRAQDTGTAVIDTALPNPITIPLTNQGTQYIFGGLQRVTDFTFSLSEIADSCRWIIRPDSAVPVEDTLSFYYTAQLRFISNACGYTHFFNINRVTTTGNAIDSAILSNPDVTNDANVTNLKIYYKR